MQKQQASVALPVEAQEYLSSSSTTENDKLYQAMMAEKASKAHKAFIAAVEIDRSVAETRESRQRDAREDASVVTSSSRISYTSNERYIEINSGKDRQINVVHTVHPMSPDECDVYSSILCKSPNLRMVAMPNHSMNMLGEIEGFKFSCSKDAPASFMPINRKMFFRTSMTECIFPETTDPSASEALFPAANETDENRCILKVLLNRNKIKEKLCKLAREIYVQSIGKEASFECIPENTDGVSEDGGTVMMGSFLTHKMADCVEWKPELPEFFGIFHAYVRNYRNGSKEHKLYVVTSGGCTNACDQFLNLSIDVGS